MSPITGSVAADSTALVTIEYSVDRGVLELQFRDGALYHYLDVPVRTYRELLEADSKGAYFNRNIRKSFRFKQLSDGAQK